MHTLVYKTLRLSKYDSIHFDEMSPHSYFAVSKQVPAPLIPNTVEEQSSHIFDEWNECLNID